MLTRAIAGIAALTLALPAPAQTVKPGVLKTFGDWTVGCDNAGRCKAVALDPGYAESDAHDLPDLPLMVVREAGPNRWASVVVTDAVRPTMRIVVTVDGRQAGVIPGATGRVEGEAAQPLIGALLRGHQARLSMENWTVSYMLTGLSAALRYMDAEQKRTGTVGALVAKGSAPDKAIAPSLPMVQTVSAIGRPASLAPARIAALRKTAGCGIAAYTDDPPAPEFHALGGGETLVLLPCDSGAYNFISSLYVLGRDGKVRAAETDAPTGMDPDAKVPSVVNGSFERGVLSSYAKGRGIGDCGVIQQFAWDGRRFRLIEQTEMSECRGSTDYITTWRARVVR